MSHVFISYSQKDREQAHALAKSLAERGIPIWWDNLLVAGDYFNVVLSDQIARASAVVVVWTDSSAASQWVIAEASLALDQKKLVPVLATGTNPRVLPVPFNSIHCTSDRDIEKLVQALSKKVALDETVKASWTKQEHRRKLVRIGIAAAVGLLVAALVATHTMQPHLIPALSKRLLAGVADLVPCSGIKAKVRSLSAATVHCVSAINFENFEFRDCPTCPQMVALPGGTFLIGSPEKEHGRDVDEGPQVAVTLKLFAISRFEVTREEWAACVKKERCADKQDAAQVLSGRHPINRVSWDDAQQYVGWLTAESGYMYRLPSESEWEYAARAGETAARFWDVRASEACVYANVGDESLGRSSNADLLLAEEKQKRSLQRGGQHTCDDKEPRLAPVGQYKPNGFQLYDMIGNVWEWVADCAFPDYTALPVNGAAYQEKNCRVGNLRGGSFLSGPASARVANRFQGGRERSNAQADFGFRVVRELALSAKN